MNITSIAPRQLTFPATKSVATPAPVYKESSALVADGFVPSGEVKTELPRAVQIGKRMLKIGVGAASGALSYGVLGKGSIGKTVAWSTGLNAAGNGLLGAGMGAFVGSVPGAVLPGLGLGRLAVPGAILGGGMGAMAGAVTGAIGGLATGLCGSLIQSVTGLPPIASGAILGGLTGLFN